MAQRIECLTTNQKVAGSNPAGGAFVTESHVCYDRDMNKFRYSVNLVVEVDAFDEIDAEDAVRDAFGLGDQCGIEIVESEVGEFTVS